MSEPKELSRDDILSAPDLQRVPLDVPEWKGRVYIQGLSGTGRDRHDALFEKMKETGDRAGYRAFVASECIVSKEGKRLFDAADIEALGRKSADALDRVLAKAYEVSKLSEDAVDQTEKNSGAVPSGNSGSS